MAVLLYPPVLLTKAAKPKAVLEYPVVFCSKEPSPTAVFSTPGAIPPFPSCHITSSPTLGTPENTGESIKYNSALSQCVLCTPSVIGGTPTSFSGVDVFLIKYITCVRPPTVTSCEHTSFMIYSSVGEYRPASLLSVLTASTTTLKKSTTLLRLYETRPKK